MKNLFYILLVLLIAIQTSAQSIPNNNFDDWYFGGIDRLWEWGNSEGCSMGDPHMAIYHVHGDFGVNYTDPAVQLRTWVDANDSVNVSFIYAGNQNFFNWQTGICELDLIRSGQPFAYRPTKMEGFYKFRNDSLHTNDFGRGIVFLRKTDTIHQTIDTVGVGYVDLHPTTSDTIREAFEVDIHYLSNEIPDTIVVAFFSTANQLSGGVLVVDSLTFDFSSKIKEVISNDAFSIAPNPTNNHLNISVDGSIDLQNIRYAIVDVNARIVKKGKIDNIVKVVDVQHLTNGVYFIKIGNERVFETLKFIKI